MAAGLPYAIAAQWAHPGRRCIAVTGSDGFARVMGELLTAIDHRLPVKVVVSNASGGRAADFASFAAANGALGLRVERAAEVDRAVRRSFAHPGPALVDVLVNPDEQPRPAMAGGA
jgi:pyruvate dehydrogenase (quinone)/pyruvate oxidase